ncbi:MAG: hypothetical protein WAL59_08065 [Roseiarcus sp.]
MAEEPDSLVLQLLREMRREIAALSESAEEHSELFKALRKDIRDRQETRTLIGAECPSRFSWAPP